MLCVRFRVLTPSLLSFFDCFLARLCSDGDPAEKLKRKIKVISDVAGEKYDEFTENLPSPKDQLDEKIDSQEIPKDDGVTKEQAAVVAPASSMATTRVTSPQGIYAKLW
jgi:hypothetical protein